MSLPKRDGVHGRYYLIHKPDTDPEVLEHADQCIQDVLDGTAKENHSGYPVVVRNQNGTPFLPSQLLERYLSKLPLKGFPYADTVAFCDALRRLAGWKEIDHTLGQYIEHQVQERYFEVGEKEDYFSAYLPCTVWPELRPEDVDEGLLRFACYVAVCYTVYGASYDSLTTEHILGLVSQLRPDMVKQLKTGGSGKLPKNIQQRKTEHFTASANDAFATIRITAKDSTEECYGEILDYLCAVLEQEEFPRSYSIEFRGPEKLYLPIPGLPKKGVNQLFACAVQYPSLHPIMERYARLAMREFEWYQNLADEACAMPGTFAVFALGLEGEPWVPLVCDYLDLCDDEHSSLQEKFIHTFFKKYGFTAQTMPVLVHGVQSMQGMKPAKEFRTLIVAGFDVYAQPKDEPAKLLSQLPELLQSMGLTLWRDGSDYLENSYLAYELEPVKDPEADWRLDVYTGVCRLPVLINDYLTARSDMVDEYHKDGIAAGFLCYPIAGFTGEERSKAVLDFRDDLRDTILREAGAEAVTFLGGATGLYCGYLDFIAWDLPAVLTAAQAFFEGSDLPYAHFHAFRRDVGGVPLLDEKEPEPDIHEETGSLLSAEDIAMLESFDEGTSGYFWRMLQWLENFIKNGVEEGRFTEKQAHQDLQIALWYAFACNNIDDYIHYYRAVEWMKDSEKNAAGCATWYYRYSVALMYCGRLEEALNYAEKGAQEEPDYPWIWLQVGKLRAHFGDKTGALDAVKQGLKLEPGDYEFLTLQQEIKAGATLEQMEYHWINPDADQTLQQGLDENADDKQRALACIRVDEAGLAEFYELFRPERYGYEKNSPCCEFQYPVKEHLVELSFRMNEAGLSKMGSDWLRQLKDRLDSGEWLTHTPEGEPEGVLTGVFVDQTRRISLVYQQPGDDQYFQLFLNPDGTKADAMWSSAETGEPEVYTEEEMEAVEGHIQQYFGEFEQVFHELVSPDIHVDICVVPPSKERDYYTLVTMGMGAHRMNVPEELAEYKLERAELAIALPKDWKLDEESMKDERWYWPIGLLKVLARLPISSNTWLGWGHTMDKQSPFAEDTKLSAAILTGPQGVEEGGEVCTLPSGEEVNFYQVIPLYQNEMEYKMEHDADALLKKMAGISFVVNPTRQNAITRGTLADEEFTGDMDNAARHLESIQEKGLPVDEINAYNHMAIYLRWCMEHDLMSVEFMERYWEQVQPFMADLSRADLRGFIRDQLKGQLFGALFNKEGAAFAGYYYGEADSPYFPSDIDNYALEYFGSEQYYSDKFQNEAYLFIPFDENYYQAMAKVIEKRFVNWQGQDFDEDTLEPSELAEAMMEYLDCECTYFPSMTDDDPIMSAYNYAKRESVKEGFVPVLMKADDEMLRSIWRDAVIPNWARLPSTERNHWIRLFAI